MGEWISDLCMRDTGDVPQCYCDTGFLGCLHLCMLILSSPAHQVAWPAGRDFADLGLFPTADL